MKKISQKKEKEKILKIDSLLLGGTFCNYIFIYCKSGLLANIVNTIWHLSCAFHIIVSHFKTVVSFFVILIYLNLSVKMYLIPKINFTLN